MVNLKVKSSVINQYMQLCPVSTSKCESFSDIEYRIARAAELGQVTQVREDEFVIGYYHLSFVVKNNEVTEMFKDKNSKYIKISERTKEQYDRVHMKMVV